MPSTHFRRFSNATSLVWGTLVLLLAVSLHAAQPDGDKKATKNGEARKKDTPKHKEHYALEYTHSFKADKDRPPELRLHGDDPGECVDFEPEGLRLRLPEGHPGKRMGTGVHISTTVKGDFEITLRYEILKEPAEADAGKGTDIFLWVDARKQGLNRGYLSRGVRAGKHFGIWYHLTPGEGQKAIDVSRTFPAKDATGRLRLVRTGSTLYHYVSEGAEGPFTLLFQHPYVTEDIHDVDWGGATGGPKASLDARFLHLSIRADGLPELAAEKLAVPEKGANDVAAPANQDKNVAPPPQRNYTWLIVAGIIGFVLIFALAGAGGMLLFLRRKSS